jgi:hypothetical protein
MEDSKNNRKNTLHNTKGQNFFPRSRIFALNHHDVLASAEAFAPGATTLLGLVKMLTYYIWRKEFHKLIDRLKKLMDEGFI